MIPPPSAVTSVTTGALGVRMASTTASHTAQAMAAVSETSTATSSGMSAMNKKPESASRAKRCALKASSVSTAKKTTCSALTCRRSR